MRIRPSKNVKAVQEALDTHAADVAAREEALKYSSEKDKVRGLRGIVNARRLGLSKHRYRARVKR